MFDAKDPRGGYTITPLQRLCGGARWRTEAMRSHDRARLLWITRGQGRICVNGLTAGFGPHNAVFIPAGTMHGFVPAGSLLGSAILFDPADLPHLPSEPAHLRIREAADQIALTAWIDMMEREAASADPAAPRAMRALAGLISVWLERQIDTAPTPKRNPQSHAQQLVEAYAALIERDFRREHSVSHYAEALGITPTHLSRVCTQATGKPAGELLAQRLHAEARHMLSETRLPINHVARHLGFTSPAYFSRAFHRHIGASPRAFRSKH